MSPPSVVTAWAHFQGSNIGRQTWSVLPMAPDEPTRISEVDFCAQVATAAEIFLANTESPFRAASIEGFGTGTSKRKRKDLCFFDRSTGGIAICGEVRLPSTAKGHSAYDAELIDNAFHKAENANVR